MTLQDIKIGDIVCNMRTKFPMKVVLKVRFFYTPLYY